MALTQIPPSMLANSGAELGSRNRIINGAMIVSQRNGTSSTTVAVGDGTTLGTDRWSYQRSSTFSAASTQQTNTVPNATFTTSLLTTITTGGSPASGDYLSLGQRIEGYNVYDLAYGTASAQTTTLSFWLRASVTGSYAASLYSPASGRSIIKTFSVASANTWVYYTITFPGDTGGVTYTDNNMGLYFRIDLGSGSSFNGTADVWAGGGSFRTSGTVTMSNTTGATLYITGVQLEVGSVATPFEREIYSNTLAKCQRYYQEIGKQMCGRAETSSLATLSGGFMVQMRSSPTATLITTANALATFGASAYTITSLAGAGYGPGSFHQSFNTSGMTVGNVVNGFQDRVLGFSAEL